MIHIEKEQNCCGCTACVNICSHKAIEMKPDALGFMYPRVDTSLCVDCGLCERICSFNDNYSKEHILLMPKAFAARHKSIKEIENSRSGAAFVALSDWILSQNGIIYGVGFRDHFRVVHKRAICKNERDEFRGSKYVQSDLGAIFKLVENDLKCKKTVLFSGTPCQVAGLLAFIPKKLRDNLYTIDIVCHGVPSPYIWRDYLYYLEKKVGKHFEKVNFRDKSKGWTSHKESYVAGNKIYYSSIYTDLFYKHIIFRPSCGICYFANLKHPADITLADFWGWEHNCPDFAKDNKGVSLVFCNTSKGVEYLKNVQYDMNLIKVEIMRCLQPNLLRPTKLNPLSEKLFQDYKNFGIEFILKKYWVVGWRHILSKILGRCGIKL